MATRCAPPRAWCGAIAAGVAGVLLSLVAPSCLPAAVYECDSQQACADLGKDARCDPAHGGDPSGQPSPSYCSTPDPSCDSTYRFHSSAGMGLAGKCTDPVCGDGILQKGETCDDGNTSDADGCNHDCRPSGQEVWKVGYASPGNVPDRCYSVAVDSQGNLGVVGEVSVDGQGENIWVRKYTADGDEVWTWVLDGDGHTDDEGWSIVAEPDDGFLVIAYLATADEKTDVWMGKIDKDGILDWEARYDGGQAWSDGGRDILRATNGDIVAIGYATVELSREEDLWFQRRSPDGQTIRWTRSRPGLADNAQDRGHGIAAVDGGYVGVGMKQTATDAYFWVEHFDEQGNTVWSDEQAVGGRPSVWTGVAAMPGGDVLLAGWIASDAGDTDMWIQRRGPDGTIVWDETIGSPSGDDDKANALVVDEGGGFVVGGEMGSGSGSTDAWIRRYDADHQEVWTFTYSGPAGERDTAWGLAFDADGNLYACGYQSTPGTDWDIWVRRFTP